MINVKEVSDNLTEVRLKAKPEDKQKYLIVSDVHYDSKSCDRKLLKKHFEQAKQEDRFIIINGDWFDVMGTYRDPRSKPADIRPEYYSPMRPYLDLVLEDSYNFLKEYANNILIIGYGNHENNISRQHDTDILDRLHYFLKKHNDSIVLGSYSGWIKFTFEHKSGGHVRSKLMHYHHGSGGGAVRSKGILKNQIDGFVYPQADIIIRGHDHQKSYDPSNVREIINAKGERKFEAQHFIRTGSYKNGLKSRLSWENQKGFMPTKLGGWFMDLTYKQESVLIELNEAQ